MLKNDQRCINVKSAVEVITTTADHSYCLPGCPILDDRVLFGHSGLADAYTKMISGCFIHQRYFLAHTSATEMEMVCKTGALSSEFAPLFFRLLSKMILALLAQWKTWFSAQCAAINWEKFCSDGIMEINMLSSSSPDAPQITSHCQQGDLVCGAESAVDNREKNKLDVSRYLDSAFNAFHRLCNRRLHDMVGELSAEIAANDQAFATMRATLKQSVSFDTARIICLAFRDLYQFDLLKNKLRLAKMVLSRDDPCHLVEYERHIHLLFIARLSAYSRLLVRYHGDTRVRDWSYVAEFFSGVHSRAIERYDGAIFVSSVLRGITINRVIPDEWNRDLLTLHLSLLHRQVRVLFVHDLVMRYFVRRYFTKTCNPKFTVHPFERRDELDYERIRFFIWLVNRSLVNDGCYEWQNAIDDAEFWRQVLAHCATLSPSTFVAQLFKYVASLDARVPVNVHDLLDYVEWLCGYDPWYMCYANSIIERFRLFSENKLQKQFTAFYESECLLFYVLVGNRLSSLDEKIKFLRERAELRIFESGVASDHLFTPDDLFNYSGGGHNTASLPSTTVPIFNWFNLSSTVFNYGVYYETIDWCAKTVQEYFAFARDEMVRSRQSSTSSLSTIGEMHRQACRGKRPLSAFDIPRDSLSEMIARAGGSKRSRCSDDTPMTTCVDIDSANLGDCHGEKFHHGIMTTNSLSAANSNSTSDNEAPSLPVLERYPTNKRFVISLLQNCMNFLNDICLMYNGSLIHKCCAESKHNYNQSNFKDRLKQSNEIWKNDERLACYRITWKDLDLHKLEESCYREKSEERVSKAIGNTLAACSTSQINVSYLRFRNDGKHSYVIFNAMLRRYEIAAPSLMYLLSLDYKNWHLSDNDCYPSAVDTRVRDYVSIALNEMDGFVDAVVRIDALSMMLHSDMIREKHIGANSAAVLLDRPTVSRYVNHANDNSPSAGEKLPSGAPELTPGDEEAITTDSREQAPFWENVTRIDDAGEDKSYVDFIIDRTEFFELSQTVPPQWIYRYLEQALHADRDSTFVYIVLLIVQIVHNYGIWVLARESFSRMITEELLLCVLPRDYLKELRTQKKAPMVDDPHCDASASYSVKPPVNAAPPGEDRGMTNVKRCDLSRFLENQFQQCLAANEHIMKRYRASYRRDAETQPILSDVGSSCGELPVNEQDKVAWKAYFHRDNDNLPGGHLSASIDTKTPTGSAVRDLFIEQDMRHFFSTNLHSTAFYRWLMSCHGAVRLADVVDLGDNAFIRLFAVFVYVLRVISRQQSRSPFDEKTLSGCDDMRFPPDSLARHIMRNAKRALHELRWVFPCRFVASRSTINLSDAFVDYLERRIMTVHDHRAKQRRNSDNRETVGGTAVNVGDTTVGGAPDDEDNDPFSDLLCALNADTEDAISPLLPTEKQIDDGGIRHVPYLRESLLSYKTRQSISYFLFFIYIFCNCDLSVTLYMLRFLASFLYPGPWAKTVAIVQGSSNSGKSNMFNLVRSFYNSDMAVLNPRALTGPKDNIGTEFLLMCENFVCQTEELKEVEAETIKTMTSDTPLQARSFHSQRQQTVGILASMVITLNQMFRIVSDEGVLERLRVIFRVTHRHLELVRKESDMTRVNCGASMNVSHQFMRSVFPRGIVPELFQRGMFHTIMNWCSSQVTSPEERFIHADRVASRHLHTLLHADMPSLLSVHEFAAKHSLNEVEASRELRRRWYRACVIQESWPLADGGSSSMQKILQQMDRRFKRSPSSNPLNAILNTIPEPTSRSMLEHYVFNVDSFNDLLDITPLRLEMRLSHARQYTNCVRLHEQYSGLFSKLRNHCDLIRYLAHTLADSHQADAPLAAAVELAPLPCVNDDEYDDNHVNLMVKPYILDLYLADLHSNIDSFVRFQHTHKVTSNESPIRKEVLQYQLKVFVDRFNATIPDAKYRVKFNEFFDRFETEYEKFKYRDARTNQIVPNLWAIRVRELVSN